MGTGGLVLGGFFTTLPRTFGIEDMVTWVGGFVFGKKGTPPTGVKLFEKPGGYGREQCFSRG